MNCREARQLFSPWLDGELTDEERRAFDEHLAACWTCTVELDKLQAVAAAMRKMRVPVAPPEGFAALVAERLRRELATAVSAGAGDDSGAEAKRPAGPQTAGGAKVVPLAGRVKSGRKGQEAARRGAGLKAAAAAGPEVGPERAAGRTRWFRQEDAGTGRAGAAGKAAVPGGAAGAAGGKAAATGAGQAVAVAGSGGKAGKAAGVVLVYARWQQGLRTGWRKSAAVAAVLLMLLSGSAALAARYIGLGGPGFFNLPVVAERVPSPPAGAGKDMNVDRVNPDNLNGPDSRGGQETAPPDKAGAEPGAAGASPGGGEEKQPAAPGSGRTNGERQLVAGNSPGASGPSGQSAGKSAGEAGESGSEKSREVTAAGGVPGGGGSVTGQPKVFLKQPRIIESMQIKVQVRDLEAASEQLKALAQAQGISCPNPTRGWTDGKAVDIFRLPLPREQVEQFANYVSALGQVTERSRQTRDASNDADYTGLLDKYQNLLEERKTASGAWAQQLDAEIKQVKAKLEAMDQEARGQVVLIVWLKEQ